MAKRGSGSNSRVSVLLAEYCEQLTLRKYSPKSIDSYRRSILDFLTYLQTRKIQHIEDVTRQHLDAYRLSLVERQFKPASTYAYMRSVRMFFRYLREAQHIFLDPAENMVFGKPEHRLQYIPSEEDIKKLLGSVDSGDPSGIRNRAILETAYSTGLRREELHRLTVKSIDPALSSLRVIGKGNRERVVPLGRTAALWIRKYLREARPKLLKKGKADELWLSPKGRAFSDQGIGVMMKTLSRNAGIVPAITPHCLRRACATHMLQHGAHPVQIQMLLGHSAMQHLSQYLRVSIKELKNAHALSNPGR
jgi:integrase/recombinase XerD